MSAKRSATSELNHYNWNAEDEPDNAGTFQKASDDVLKKRVIRTARRRGVLDNADVGEDAKEKSAFGGFSGFSNFQTQNPTSAFGFLQSNAPPSNVITNGVETKKPSDATKTSFSFKDEGSKNEEADKSDYYAKLKGLNESVLSWIEEHVKENPLIDLSPIFADYKRHLKDLDVKKSTVVEPSAKKDFSTLCFKSPQKSPTENKFTFGIPADVNTQPEKILPIVATSILNPTTTATTTFTFGAVNTTKAVGSKAGFMWTSSSSATNLFSGAKLAPSAQPIASESEKAVNDEQDEDEPPKVVFTPVVETDHIYKARCKVFVKKNAEFSDRGVGNLYLKRVPDSQKVQLIVRADTNLGNLLCNLILGDTVPMKRMGKKDVMLVCIPTPDSKPPPVPMLLRVKSAEEADALLKELEMHK